MQRYNIIIELMGNTFLSKIDDKWITDLRQKLITERKATTGTLKRYSFLISHVLKKAGMKTLTMDFTGMKDKSLRHIIYTEEQVDLMLKKLSEQKWKHKDIYKDLIIILYHTGLRVNDAINLNNTNIDLVGKMIRVLTKKKCEPVEIPMSPKVYDILSTGKRFDRIVYLRFYEKIKILLELCEIPQGSIHTFRHSFISKCISKGMRLEMVKEIAGHSSIEQTMKYIHVATPDKIKAMSLVWD